MSTEFMRNSECVEEYTRTEGGEVIEFRRLFMRDFEDCARACKAKYSMFVDSDCEVSYGIDYSDGTCGLAKRTVEYSKLCNCDILIEERWLYRKRISKR